MTKWGWGDLHRTSHMHPLSASFPVAAAVLDPPSVRIAGGGDTPLAGGYPLIGGFAVGVCLRQPFTCTTRPTGQNRAGSPLWGRRVIPAVRTTPTSNRLWAAVETIPQLWGLGRDRANGGDRSGPPAYVIQTDRDYSNALSARRVRPPLFGCRVSGMACMGTSPASLR